jgi:NAD+ synthase
MMDFGTGTDEEKMGITYKQISEYIETGSTDKNVIPIIERMHKASEHKRNLVPVYKRK